MIRIWTFASILLTLTGCVSYHDVSNSPDVRPWHIVGKTYVANRDLPILARTQPRGFPRVATGFDPAEIHPIAVIPRGTLLRIDKVVEEEIPLATTYTHPLTHVALNGKPTQVSLWDAMEFAAGLVPAAARGSYLRPYPPMDLYGAPVETLRRALGHPDYAHRYYAVQALSARALPGGEREARLAAAASDPDPDVRLLALTNLKALGPPHTPQAAAAFVRALTRRPSLDAEPHLAHAALLAIGPDVIPELLRALDREPNIAAWYAADSLLAEFGPAAAPHLPAVVSLATAHPKLAWPLTGAMGRMDPRAAVRLFTPMLREPATRDIAARLIGPATLGARYDDPTHRTTTPTAPEAAAAIDALIACLDDPDNGTMEAAATALAAFGLLARRALPALERLRFQFRADHPDSSPRRGIDVAIAGIAVDARPGGHDPTPPTAPAQP